MLPKELIRAIPAARVVLERKAGGSCQNIGRAALAPIPAITRPPITSQALVGARAARLSPAAAISNGMPRCQRRSRRRSEERPMKIMKAQPAR